MPEPPDWVPRGGWLSAADDGEFAQVRGVTVSPDVDRVWRDVHQAAGEVDATSDTQEHDCGEQAGKYGQAKGE
jgi:hypothetical protein